MHPTLGEWTEANGLLTATQKTRSGQTLDRYREAVEGLYRT